MSLYGVVTTNRHQMIEFTNHLYKSNNQQKANDNNQSNQPSKTSPTADNQLLNTPISTIDAPSLHTNLINDVLTILLKHDSSSHSLLNYNFPNLLTLHLEAKRGNDTFKSLLFC